MVLLNPINSSVGTSEISGAFMHECMNPKLKNKANILRYINVTFVFCNENYHVLIKTRKELLAMIQNVNTNSFDDVALEVFKYQLKNNQIYRNFVINLRGKESNLKMDKPVFLPITAFKQNIVKSASWASEKIFYSSSTTKQGVSEHHIRDILVYYQSCFQCWEEFYGAVSDYEFLCLLPGYMERTGSSLVAMLDYFVQTKSKSGGFYLYNHEALFKRLIQKKEEGHKKLVLFGVSYALLDFVENFSISYPELIVMETGGMKGTRREMIKSEFHELLKKGFDVSTIHSEYGMTELFSQAYSKGNGLFLNPKSMKVSIQEITDPLNKEKYGKTGVVQIVDLHNLDTCSFIQTQDLGIQYEDGSFELMGRMDEADIRGCNLMVV
jgi:hypothetical protein